MSFWRFSRKLTALQRHHTVHYKPVDAICAYRFYHWPETEMSPDHIEQNEFWNNTRTKNTRPELGFPASADVLSFHGAIQLPSTTMTKKLPLILSTFFSFRRFRVRFGWTDINQNNRRNLVQYPNISNNKSAVMHDIPKARPFSNTDTTYFNLRHSNRFSDRMLVILSMHWSNTSIAVPMKLPRWPLVFCYDTDQKARFAILKQFSWADFRQWWSIWI